MERRTVLDTLEGLQDIVARARAMRQDRLPPVKSLALQLHASPVTVCRALSVLKSQGVIDSAPRRGIRILRGAPDSDQQAASRHPTVVHVPKFRLLQREIEEWIRTGRFSPGETLPTIKMLAADLGSSYLPVKRALEILREQRWIRLHRRHYIVSPSPAVQPRSRIAFLSAFESLPDVVHLTQRAVDLTRLIEEQCGTRGISLVGQCVQEVIASNGKSLAIRDATTPLLGIIVLTAALEAQTLRKLFGLFDCASPPIVAVRIYEDSVIERVLPARAGVSLVTVEDDRSIGRKMAIFLSGLGHRSAAYLSPFHRTPGRWSGLRASGRYSVMTRYWP